MTTTLAFIGALALFAIGIRLSAFFSGSETGFYRVSFLRLSFDAQAGDTVAQRIMWFARNPSYFVATTLVGNNVANYLTTLAIGLATASLYATDGGWLKVSLTLALSPVVFIFGELVPKNLYYRAPLYLLRRGSAWFAMFFRLFLVVSFPLIWLTKLIEGLGGAEERAVEFVLGRSRLVQLLSEGRQHGLLTDVQSRLVNGLMDTAAQPVTVTMTPAGRALGVAADASRETVLEHARRYGLTNVPVKRAGTADEWFGYLRTVDVAVRRKPLAALIRTMPRIPASAKKLEAMLTLRNCGATLGVVHRGETVLGIVNERGLVEQLFRSPQHIGARTPAGP